MEPELVWESKKCQNNFYHLETNQLSFTQLKNFLFVPDVDVVYVAVHPNWVSYFNDLLDKHILTNKDKIRVVSGGGNRNDSILSIIADIKNSGSFHLKMY